jgi:subtilase family serine protease
VTFVASTGDSTTTPFAGEYPAFSPNVVAVGGTTLSLNPDNSYKSEVAWNINNNPGDVSAGGISQFEPLPEYQHAVTPFGATNVNNMRMIPDVSLLAGTDPTNPGTVPATGLGSSNPAAGSGVATYDSYQDGSPTAALNPWFINGGTSLATPAFAGLIAIGDQLRQSVGEAPLNTSQTLSTLYSMPASAFHDITSGNNLVPFFAGPGYDLVTGIGSPVANVLVPALAGAPVLASVQRVGIHHQTAIDLSFFGALDPHPAQHLDNYRLLVEGPNGLFNHKIPLRSATYPRASQTVVLMPKHLSLNHTYELVVRGTKPHGLRGANGIFLAGGNQTVIFSGFTPSSPVT